MIIVLKCFEIRVVVLFYYVLYVRKMVISFLRLFRDLLFLGDEIFVLKCFSNLDKCSIV